MTVSVYKYFQLYEVKWKTGIHKTDSKCEPSSCLHPKIEEKLGVAAIAISCRAVAVGDSFCVLVSRMVTNQQQKNVYNLEYIFSILNTK